MPVRKTLKELMRITSHQHADMRIIDLAMLDEFGSNKYNKGGKNQRQVNRKSQPRQGAVPLVFYLCYYYLSRTKYYYVLQ